MSNEALPKDILQLIKPQQVRGYAIAKGWQRVPNVNGEIALFNHPGAKWDQLIVPMDESIDDYSKRLRDVVEILAQFESRPATQVLNDLLTPESDILRYRVASPATGRGFNSTDGRHQAVGRREAKYSCSGMQRCEPYRTSPTNESAPRHSSFLVPVSLDKPNVAAMPFPFLVRYEQWSRISLCSQAVSHSLDVPSRR